MSQAVMQAEKPTQKRDIAVNMIEQISEDLKTALPANISFEKFKTTFITAVLHNPDILACDPASVKTSLMKCAVDNLLPDGREAAIVPYNTKVKGADGKDAWVKLAQYTPMVLGVRKRAKELGGVNEIICECVYENDAFDYEAGDNPKISHKPAPLNKEPGKVVGAYVIFKDRDGAVMHRDVLPLSDIMKAKKVSKSGENGPWGTWFSEMAKKTAIRRGAKGIPSMPDELRRIIERDDEYVDLALANKPEPKKLSNPFADEKSNAAFEDRSTKQQSQAAPADHAAGKTGADPSPAPGGAAGEKSASAMPVAPRSLYDELNTGMTRARTVESVKKIWDKFLDDNKDSKVNETDKALAFMVYGMHQKRFKEGLDVNDASAAAAERIEEAF